MPFKFEKQFIEDVFEIIPVRFNDERGFFEEIFKNSDFEKAGIITEINQVNFSHSSKGILRGLHYQLQPYTQSKIVRVISGTIFDVAVDLRKGSPTFAKWIGNTLDSKKGNMLFIPEGFAHGFEVLSEEADFEYLCSNIYAPEYEQGIIYNDKDLNIPWTTKNPLLSPKDLKYPSFKNAEYNFIYKGSTDK